MRGTFEWSRLCRQCQARVPLYSQPCAPFRLHRHRRAIRVLFLLPHARCHPKPVLKDPDDLTPLRQQLAIRGQEWGNRTVHTSFRGSSKCWATLRDPALSNQSNRLALSWIFAHLSSCSGFWGATLDPLQLARFVRYTRHSTKCLAPGSDSPYNCSDSSPRTGWWPRLRSRRARLSAPDCKDSWCQTRRLRSRWDQNLPANYYPTYSYPNR